MLRITVRSIAFVAAAALKRLPDLDPMPLADMLKRFVRYTAFPTLEHEARRLLARKGSTR